MSRRKKAEKIEVGYIGNLELDFPGVSDRIQDYFKGLFLTYSSNINKEISAGAINLLYDDSGVSRTFALHQKSHPFDYSRLSWGLHMSEPQVTGALGSLLDADNDQLRLARAQAFLRAMGCEFSPDFAQLSDFTAEAESFAGRQRIDLLCRWGENGKNVLLVETKFNHKLTERQLNSYHEFIRNELPECHLDLVVIGLNPDEFSKLPYSVRRSWRFISWHRFWLNLNQMEMTDDPPFQNFLFHLWSRIGAFKQGKKK